MRKGSRRIGCLAVIGAAQKARLALSKTITGKEGTMSLWQKPAAEISFADVDVFLSTKLPEGHRLDYKLQFPNDLAKTIAAFANTLGGTIMLGVDSDKGTNEPVWPPVAGMSTPGVADRVVQIATEAIYPPVRVSVAVVANERLAGHQIAVIRVDESKRSASRRRKTAQGVCLRKDGQQERSPSTGGHRSGRVPPGPQEGS